MRVCVQAISKIFLIVIFCVAFHAPVARADIMLNPQRIFFGDRDRVADINITNTANTPALFKIQLYYLRQTETGSYEEISGPLDPAFDPAKFIVYSPKQVRLPANASQRIRVSLRRPADLPAGEYRAHLRLKRIAEPVKPAPGQPGISTSMTINVGFSVPIIVRQGVTNAAASIGDIKLIPATAKKPALLQVSINRTGNYSTLGSVKVFAKPPGGQETQIGILNNFNIYTENSKRVSQIPLTQNNIPSGALRLVYEGAGPDQGKIFDEKIFPVGG